MKAWSLELSLKSPEGFTGIEISDISSHGFQFQPSLKDYSKPDGPVRSLKPGVLGIYGAMSTSGVGRFLDSFDSSFVKTLYQSICPLSYLFPSNRCNKGMICNKIKK